MPFSFLHNQLVYVTKFFAPAEIKISGEVLRHRELHKYSDDKYYLKL